MKDDKLYWLYLTHVHSNIINKDYDAIVSSLSGCIYAIKKKFLFFIVKNLIILIK